MGDISREPLPGGPRSKGPAGKGPAEVIRLDELTVDERMETADPEPHDDVAADDPAARAFPSPRMAPAAPLSIEPFALPVAERPRPASESDAVVAEPEVGIPGESAHDESAHDGTAHDGAAEDEDARADVAGGVEPTVFDPVEPEVAPVVPEVDELVSDELDSDDALGAGVSRAEPMLALGPGEDSDDAPPLTDPAEVARVLVSVLLCAREPLSVLRLAEVCNSTESVVEQSLDVLGQLLREQGLPLEVLQVGDGVRLATTPVVYPYLTRLKKLKKAERLSPAALETLAVIAYRQPVIRLEVEAIRGVKVGPMLKSLLDHKLVKILGRAEVPGRPLQYGTTQTFLDRFGLRSLKDLPSVQEFRSLG